MTTWEPLYPADLEVLEFARAAWGSLGRRDTVILERFGHTATRYFQRLNTLLDHPGAEAYDAQLIRQLQRIRTIRHDHRTGRTHPA